MGSRMNPVRKAVFVYRLGELINRSGSPTNSEIAKMTGLSTPAIAQYRSGRLNPGLEAVIALSDYFAVPLDFLVGRMNEEKARRILENYSEHFMEMKRSVYEQDYIFSRKKFASVPGYEAPFPYNLYEEVFGCQMDDIINSDQENGMYEALDYLSDTKRDMILLYFKDGMTLFDIGQKYQLSGSRVRQIINSGIKRLRSRRGKELMMYGVIGCYQKTEYNKLLREIELGRAAAEHDFNEYLEQIKLKKEMADILSGKEEQLRIMASDIAELDLSVRGYNCLKRQDLRTVADVIAYDKEHGLETVRNLGKVCAAEIRGKLAAFGADMSYREGA